MARQQSYDNASATVGDTPMIRLNRLVPDDHATVFAKCEFFQWQGSEQEARSPALPASSNG